ncbi:MAG: DegT/DnrJ/EryC1/StrS family aminotransferase [Desulfovibrio sp.]
MSDSNTPRLYLSPPHMGGTELDHIHAAFESNFIAPLGPQVNGFEQAFQNLTGFAHCGAFSCGTAALHLALRLLGVGKGDIVLASSLTFIGSVSAVTFLGAELVFVDSDHDTWNMDPDALAQAIDTLHKEGKQVKAVLPTDLYGQCADYDRIMEICNSHNIPVLADSAESVGAGYKGRHAGKGATAAIYSFNGNKIITTSGGGMLGSDNEEFIAKARWLSQQAREDEPYYEHKTIGYNYRMSNVVAAIGLGQLEVLEERVNRRREIHDLYAEALSDLPITFMPEAAYGRHNRWLTVIQIDPASGVQPETVRLALEEDNIESRPVWKPMHMQPVFAGNRMFGGAVSEELFANGLCLPSGTAMTDNDMDRVISKVRKTLG